MGCQRSVRFASLTAALFVVALALPALGEEPLGEGAPSLEDAVAKPPAEELSDAEALLDEAAADLADTATTTATAELEAANEDLDFATVPDESAMDRWNDQHPWHYDTDYLMPLTRGLEYEGVPQMVRPLAWLVTVPIDIAQAPFGALAGLFGP